MKHDKLFTQLADKSKLIFDISIVVNEKSLYVLQQITWYAHAFRLARNLASFIVDPKLARITHSRTLKSPWAPRLILIEGCSARQLCAIASFKRCESWRLATGFLIDMCEMHILNTNWCIYLTQSEIVNKFFNFVYIPIHTLFYVN